MPCNGLGERLGNNRAGGFIELELWKKQHLGCLFMELANDSAERLDWLAPEVKLAQLSNQITANGSRGAPTRIVG